MRGPHANRMQTTITIDDELLAAAKAEVARSGRTLNAVVEDALREALAQQGDRPPTRVELPTLSGGRLLPGVNLDNLSELLDLEDEEHFRRVTNDQRHT